jgi:hypothetical protein
MQYLTFIILILIFIILLIAFSIQIKQMFSSNHIAVAVAWFLQVQWYIIISFLILTLILTLILSVIIIIIIMMMMMMSMMMITLIHKRWEDHHRW